MKRAPKSRPPRESVGVWLDADCAGPLCHVGTLFNAGGAGDVVSFEYEPAWLARPDAFEIDPELQLYGGENFGRGSFRIFSDSAPDRWGRRLMDRREALVAREQARTPRRLGEWDYLLGVHDTCRLGALRFRRDAGSPFLDDNDAYAAPPVTSLRELEAAAAALDDPHAEDDERYCGWLRTLLAPGSSLGGARPKASFVAPDGALWIAKFPSRNDRHDVGAWEYLVHVLARHAGLRVPEAQLLTLGGAFRTFACKRFDRDAQGRRRFFVSAMTLLGKDDGCPASYLDLAEFLSNHGAKTTRDGDLVELWRRLAFNVLVGNRDDHLRNHGFIFTGAGWMLAPAYDVNPNRDKATHALTLNEADDSPSTAVVLETASYYGLSQAVAARELAVLRDVIGGWRTAAQDLGIPRSECEAFSGIFEPEGTPRV